jgi:hypothetical protein
MKFKAGDKVRVKSLEEIEKISDHEGDCYRTYFEYKGHRENCYFNIPCMKDFCGKVFTIKKALEDDGRYTFLENEAYPYVFIDDWLEEPIKSIYVSSFDECAEIEETESIVKANEKEQFIKEVFNLESEFDQCLATDCIDCCMDYCAVKQIKSIIRKYKGVKYGI